jgi:ABC-type dipeptide/oligopeptide/nickel transport system permease subunit
MDRTLLWGLILTAAVALPSIFGPWLSPHDALTSDFVHGLGPGELPVGPSSRFWLGADRLFRDQFTRLCVGGRFSLFIAVSATAMATGLGTLVGVVSGMNEGGPGPRAAWVLACAAGLGGALCIAASSPAAGVALLLCSMALGVLGLRGNGGAVGGGALGGGMLGHAVDADTFLMRSVDVLLSFPFLLFVMALGTVFDKTSVWTVALTLGATGWLHIARIVRSRTLQLRDQDYVIAARALGQSPVQIVTKHILPNLRSTLLVLSALSVAQMILAESVLSYLGAGVSPPAPTWGRMLFEGQDYVSAAPWLLFAPATVVLVCVVGLNLIGEGLRRGYGEP